MERRLVVWKPGTQIPPPTEDTKPKAKAKKKNNPDAKKADAEAGEQPANEDDDEPDGETPLEAFERRAAVLMDSLGQSQPAAEWKAPTGTNKKCWRNLRRRKA